MLAFTNTLVLVGGRESINARQAYVPTPPPVEKWCFLHKWANYTARDGQSIDVTEVVTVGTLVTFVTVILSTRTETSAFKILLWSVDESINAVKRRSYAATRERKHFLHK
jgi:hypothetical protein